MQTDQLPTLGGDGWNVYHSVDRWAPPPQATPPLYLPCRPFFFSVRAPYQCSFELPPLSIIDFNTVSFKSYLLSSQCRPLSKCHTEIYATVSCQTRLLLVRGFGRKKNPYLLLINGGRFRGDTCGLTQKEEWCGSIWRVPLYSLCTVWLIYWTRSLSQNDLLVPLSQVNSCFDAPSITSLYVGLLQTVLLQTMTL